MMLKPTVPAAMAARVLVGTGDAMTFGSVIRLVPAWFEPRRVPIITQATGVGEYGHALAEYYQSIADERLCRRCTGNMEHVERDVVIQRDAGLGSSITDAEYLALHDYFGRGANDVMKRLKQVRGEVARSS